MKNNLKTAVALFFVPILIVPFAAAAQPVSTEGTSVQVNFAGPDAVRRLLEEKPRPAIEGDQDRGWYEWKERLKQDHGFSLGLDYTAVSLASSETGGSGENHASGGMVRVYGSWDIAGLNTNNTGSIIYKLEHRHAYTTLSPKEFGFDQGYAGLIEPPFSDEGGRWTNLYWNQRLNEGRSSLAVGLLDVTDFVNVYSMASPWTGFMNFAFSTGSATMFIPNDAGMGIAGATMLTDRLFLIGNLVNAYTDSTKPFDTVDDFFSGNEYFSSIELGWTSAPERIFLDNLHLTLWHVDESMPAGTPGGWGMVFNYSRALDDDRFMPFIRGGYADEGGALLQKSLSAGMGINTFEGRDQLGIAVNWGQPNANTLNPGLENQQVFETYYRWQISKEFALTPDLQYIVNPALNPERDHLWIFGFRGRLAL